MGKEAIIDSSNRTAEFFVLEEIRPDREYFDWASGTMKTRKSTTSQNYFVDHLANLSGEFTVKLYINSMGGDVKEALDDADLDDIALFMRMKALRKQQKL